MATGIAEVGEREFTGSFNWDNNELHRKIYVRDFTKITTVLNLIFGSGSGSLTSYTPHNFQYPFNNYYAFSASFTPIHSKSTCGSDETDLTNDTLTNFLALMPVITGGVIIDITYKPFDLLYHTTDETWDSSGQIMTIMANSISQKNNKSGQSNCMRWSQDYASLTNINGMSKIVSKVDITIKKMFLKSAPTDVQLANVGKVNGSTVNLMTKTNGELQSWEPETLLLQGMPTIRRYRWDGRPVFETTIKLSGMTFKDCVAPVKNSNNIVGWNRLYRVDKGWWDYVVMPVNNSYLYPRADFNFINQIGQTQ